LSGVFIASIPLVVGCIVALFVSLPKNIIAAIMAFVSGVLVAALTFSLVEEAFNLSPSIPPVVIGFILGGTSYSVANRVLDKKSTTSSRSNSSNNSTGFLPATVRNRKSTMVKMQLAAKVHLDYHYLLVLSWIIYLKIWLLGFPWLLGEE